MKFIFFFFPLIFANNEENCRIGNRDLEYYSQVTHAFGIPLVATREVHPSAIALTCKYFEFLIQDNQEIARNLRRRNHKVVILGRRQELARDVPEYRGYEKKLHSRGVGGTRHNPVTVIPEENVLCLKEDKQPGDIILHELAHAIHLVGTPRGLLQKISRSYKYAQRHNLFLYNYAAQDPREYFAVGVQTFLNKSPVENYATFDQPHRRPLRITRDHLFRKDRHLYSLIENVLLKKEGWKLPKRCEIWKNGIIDPKTLVDYFDQLL